MSARKRSFDKDSGEEVVSDDGLDSSGGLNRSGQSDQLDSSGRKRTKFEPAESSQSGSGHRTNQVSERVGKESIVEDSDSENYDDIDYGDDEDDIDLRDEKLGQESKSRNVRNPTDDEQEDRGDADQDSGRSAEEGCQEEQGETSGKEPMEKCKFWPSCNAGDECSYYHPTKPCRAFPNCRFGMKCLYIHPTCKFHPCKRSECPFAHPIASSNTRRLEYGHLKCKFGFKCTNLMCKFSHQRSEPCRFGANCLLDTCSYTHPSDNVRKKPVSSFKWSAQS